MATTPETRYAKSGDLRIAYQVIGDGPIDIVHVPGFVSHMELRWEMAGFSATQRRLAAFARVVSFDKRAPGSPTAPLGCRRWRSAWTTCGR